MFHVKHGRRWAGVSESLLPANADPKSQRSLGMRTVHASPEPLNPLIQSDQMEQFTPIEQLILIDNQWAPDDVDTHAGLLSARVHCQDTMHKKVAPLPGPEVRPP